jgi:glycosyltransferase involved in cell wall biosynthesis
MAVERRIGSLGLARRVELFGAVDDLAAFFSQVDVLVVPSTGNEGQPTVIVEALAHGRSVLVRAPLWSREFQPFPVHAYGSARELGALLDAVGQGRTVDRDRVAKEFGAQQVIDSFERAARLVSVPV